MANAVGRPIKGPFGACSRLSRAPRRGCMDKLLML